ncbi:MAG: fatty acid desaturase [Caldilineaceae bacterium]|jgi:omega-6 fatty acid desaturase (delta-12 desaturase)|nr:fatty acid desaturase [Caldilineaceae bacterium]
MDLPNQPAQDAAIYEGWRQVVAKYQRPDARKSIWQLINSFGGLFLCWVLMYFSLNIGYWLTLLLAIPAAGFAVRIFIIQHDCGHGSFFKSRRANDSTGVVCSLFTLTPYKYWRKSHAIHHAHHAELEERGIGDVWTMTVDEYLAAPWWKKVAYRVFRHPLFLFGVAPGVNFLILERFPIEVKKEWRNGERESVLYTNLALLGLFTLFMVWVGVGAVLVIFLPTFLIAAAVGTWLFYVQHQFERTYWEHTPEWDYTLAAMHGSSYYRLPKVLQWFTGNIGFHHIHHLSPRIPNYNLERCHAENPIMQRVVQLTLWSSFKTTSLALWDEKKQRLVTFKEALQYRTALTQNAG